METTNPSDINDTIWITSRVRMIAERKSLRNQTVSFLAVTYYSLFSVILSIFSDYYSEPYPLLDKITLSSSIVILAASLIASSFRLEGRATSYRECYLKLQTLYDEPIQNNEKRQKYRELMLAFPNHSPYDYTDFLVNHKLLEGKLLKNGTNELNYTKYMLLSFLVRSSFFYITIIILFLAPVSFLLWPLFFFSSPS